MNWSDSCGHRRLMRNIFGQVYQCKSHVLQSIAPNLIKIIPKRALKQRTVAQALQNRSWVADTKGALTIEVCWNTCNSGT
jgi:sulfatase maturation enzyme AslB (radical SAM superfamily)